jgi:hypothetical protein
MPGLIDLFRGLEPLMPRAGLLEGLVDVLDDVGAVFDTDRKPDGFRQHELCGAATLSVEVWQSGCING